MNIIGSNVPITYRSMHPVLAGDNPDNSYSIIPFEKGFQLLQYIEDSVIGYNMMEDFITYYIENNYLMSINRFDMMATFAAFVEENYTESSSQVNSILSMVNYEEWLYEVGLDPTGTLNFTCDMTAVPLNLANAYANTGNQPTNYTDYNAFTSAQRVVFLQTLMDNVNTDIDVITLIDEDLSITDSIDPEVMMRWYTIGLYL